MEVVHAFNNELSSLYDVKPPISKAKMTQITKSAIKGIKLYKHIVQSVEKFIQKCRPEYKVPGLYVVDSIVRQSRHQFGTDRDVFGPRFARNINVTFQHLFKCPEEERPKIVRVLNLWQKNQVFPSEMIQPLMNMAVPTPPSSQPSQPAMTHSPPEPPKAYQDTSWGSWAPDTASNQGNATSVPSAAIDPQILLQLQQHLAAAAAASNSTDNSTPTAESVKFDKKLLDFDYGDEEEEEEETKRPQAIETNALALSMAQNLLNNPDLLRQLQQMNFQHPVQEPPPPMPPSPDKSSMMYPGESAVKIEMYNSAVPPPPYMAAPPPTVVPTEDSVYPPLRMDVPAPAFGLQVPEEVMEEPPPVYVQQDFPPQDLDERILPQVVSADSQEMEKSSVEHERSRSPRGSRRSNRRHRSRSPRFKRGRSRSRSRRRGHSRSRSRERERERKHRGLLPLKKNHLSVYSTTLWLGHLSKLASEADLSDAFGEYGTILSIDMIPPRGCAFICMSRRQDALRALQKLKNLKLHGSVIKMAWAPGKGVKEKEYRDYWDVDTGVSHIPYEKLHKDTLDLDYLEEGGMVDEESAPDFIREMLKAKRESGKLGGAMPQQVAAPETQQPMQQPPAAEPAPLLTPTVPPPVMPGHISMLHMPPFGMPMMPPPQTMVIPMGVPPPNPMMMVGAMMPPPHYLPPTAAALSPESSHTDETINNPPPFIPPPMDYPPPASLPEPATTQQEPPTSYQSYPEPEPVEPPKPKSRALLPDPILDQNGLPIVPQQGPPRDNFPRRENYHGGGGGFNHREGFPPRGDFHHRNREFHPPPPHDSNFHPPPMDGFPPPQDNFYPRDNFGPPPPRGRGFGPPRGGGFFPPPPPFHRDREFHPRGFPRGMRGPRGRGFFYRGGGFRGRRGGGNWDNNPMWGGGNGPQEEWEDYPPPPHDQEMDQGMEPDGPIQEATTPTAEFEENPETAALPKEEEPSSKEFIPRNPRRKNTRWNMEAEQPMTEELPAVAANGPSNEDSSIQDVPPAPAPTEFQPPTEEAAS